jgi:hypothetical protein
MVRWATPLIVLAFYSVTAAGYGVFRDELYYFASARHLDWGYVDHPPMIAVLAALVRTVFGESWLAARLLSALAVAATVLLVGDTARELGGGRWAWLLAQVLCATAPVYLALFSIFSMNATRAKYFAIDTNRFAIIPTLFMLHRALSTKNRVLPRSRNKPRISEQQPRMALPNWASHSRHLRHGAS